MLQRCYNKKCTSYVNYGARGIKVCVEWRNSFEVYKSDMVKKNNYLRPGYTVDRINNDGDYTNGNTRWANYSTQNSNQRISKRNTSGVKGVCFHKKTKLWRVSLQIDGKQSIVAMCKDKEDAIVVSNMFRNPSNKRIHGEVRYTTLLTPKGTVWLTNMLKAEYDLD